MSDTATAFQRDCPECKETIYHANARSLRRALALNKPCRECSNPSRGKIKTDKLRAEHYDPVANVWFKQCPSCKEKMTYTSRKGLKRGVRDDYICKECALQERNDEFAPIKFNPTYYDTTTETWFRTCKGCGEQMLYAAYETYCQGEEFDQGCKSCARKKEWETQTYRDIRTEGITAAWADPQSGFNTEEFRNQLVENCLKMHQKCREEGLGLYSEEWRERARQWMLTNMNDPNSLIRQSLATDEVRKRMSEGRKLANLNPNARINDPVYRQECHERLMKGGFVAGKRTSKGEAALFECVKGLGFIHNKMEHRIGRFWPDIIHLEKMIIIEYYGDLWHANPKVSKYAEDTAVVKLTGGRTKLAGDIRKYDEERKQVLIGMGYTVLVVWEYDFKSKRTKTIDELLSQLDALL